MKCLVEYRNFIKALAFYKELLKNLIFQQIYKADSTDFKRTKLSFYIKI